ncbi:hypothetical protein [Sphingosinicella microcystinivorans]|uniref:Uncharacterized protein n=1 Tax=Sphingosinicella microcystinivorans TaxID=335406 RepID=A0AAD1D707_SPHMI|nr:hypothetical protein [Sphingosinicella microcystinivorans]RKS91820.1 hypothetical protein DFR51_1391 [Sphingosinicella microcystinivorans]BBE34804.1 hypothetical protein SmB9_24620 [Sphingosinicella microcystinivorans]
MPGNSYATASEKIDAENAALADWRGKMLAETAQPDLLGGTSVESDRFKFSDHLLM